MKHVNENDDVLSGVETGNVENAPVTRSSVVVPWLSRSLLCDAPLMYIRPRF